MVNSDNSSFEKQLNKKARVGCKKISIIASIIVVLLAILIFGGFTVYRNFISPLSFELKEIVNVVDKDTAYDAERIKDSYAHPEGDVQLLRDNLSGVDLNQHEYIKTYAIKFSVENHSYCVASDIKVFVDKLSTDSSMFLMAIVEPPVAESVGSFNIGEASIILYANTKDYSDEEILKALREIKLKAYFDIRLISGGETYLEDGSYYEGDGEEEPGNDIFNRQNVSKAITMPENLSASDIRVIMANDN